MPIVRITVSLVLAAGLVGGGELLARPAGPATSQESLAGPTRDAAPDDDRLAELRRRIAGLMEELDRLRRGEESAATGEDDGGAEAPAPAVEVPAPRDRQELQERVDELERRLEILTEELERLRSGEAGQAELTEERARALGLAPSAAALYRQERGVSIAGYGEALYENFASEDERGAPTAGGAQFDFLRAILYAGYRFNDKFLFNSEIEVEHADEIFVEFAYIDYLVSESLGIRGGMLLIPMGLVNEFHEPTVFIGARRPETEQRIIPSTWRENGVGIHGSLGERFSYRAYLVNGLDATGFSATGLRGGRQKGSKARAQDMAVVGRLDFTPTPGVFLGGSVYSGGSGQGQIEVDGREFSVDTTIFELHGQAQLRGFDLRGLYARAELDDAAELSRALGLGGTAGVGDSMEGYYLQLGYDVLSQTSSGEVSLLPYYRYERVDTQASMPAGFTRSPATDVTFHTFGLELKPTPGVVLKADYQLVSNEAGTGRDQFNVALGYAF